MKDLIRTVTDNDMHVIMRQFITAADSIHVAMCRFDDDHAAQKYLNEALQSVLIGAEQCRQLHDSKKQRILPTPQDEGSAQ